VRPVACTLPIEPTLIMLGAAHTSFVRSFPPPTVAWRLSSGLMVLRSAVDHEGYATTMACWRAVTTDRAGLAVLPESTKKSGGQSTNGVAVPTVWAGQECDYQVRHMPSPFCTGPAPPTF
jgi:hypothetical protein